MSTSLRGLAAVPRTLARRPRDISLPTPTPSQAFATAAATARRSRTPPKPYTEPTGSEASAYLSSLLSLPSSAFPPSLALQILTHKSYRYVHRISHPPPYTAAEAAQQQASHNARLAFIGRRAMAAYTAMFVHSNVGSSAALAAVDFLRGKTLDEKLDNLRHQQNLGRQVGDPWKIADVMRWDRNLTGQESGYASIKGQAVEAVVGAVFTQYGSAAAQRAFLIHVLPLLSPQLRDPSLIEAAKKAKQEAAAAGVA